MSIIAYALLFMVVLTLITTWVWCLFQILARPDIRVWAKVLWLVGILVLPFIGAPAYIIYAKRRGPVDDTKEWGDKSAAEIEAEVYRSNNMTASQRVDHLF